MNITRSIKQFKFSISQEFHDKTKISVSRKELPVKKWPDSWKTIYHKGYARFKALKLQEPILDLSVSFREVMNKRHSGREFSGRSIKLTEISTLLYYTAGLKGSSGPMKAEKRFYPSAGGRYPIEVYPILLISEKINPGIYHYYPKSHLLEVLPIKSEYKIKAIKFFGGQQWAKKASAFLIMSAIFNRTTVKYGDRGYRHVLTELGFMMQNIYLTCTALGLKCCPSGGFLDEGLNSLLDLDGIEESVIGVVAIG